MSPIYSHIRPTTPNHKVFFPTKFPSAQPHEWDYSFTTMYAGSVSVAGLGEGQPAYTNATSIYSRPAVEIYAGDGTLRVLKFQSSNLKFQRHYLNHATIK